MKHAALAVCLLAAAAIALAGETTPAEAVAKLSTRNASYGDWMPILEIGKPAIPELKKLVMQGKDPVRAQAAVLLYRLGEASALDVLAMLLDSPDEDARREAAGGLLAFVGEPMDYHPAAPPEERAAQLARWKAWWKANRGKALGLRPMKQLFGRVIAADKATKLVALSLTGRHGLKRGMTVQVSCADGFVCRLAIVAAPPEAGAGRVEPLSARRDPQVGDRVFWTQR